MLGFGINAVLEMAEVLYSAVIRGLTPRDATSVEFPGTGGDFCYLLTPLGGAILLSVSELISYH